MSERDISRLGVDGKPPLPMHGHAPLLPNSKSVPAALQHVGSSSNNNGPSAVTAAAAAVAAAAVAANNSAVAAGKSRSIGNLMAANATVGGGGGGATAGGMGDQSFYQNLSVYRNQSQPNLGEQQQQQHQQQRYAKMGGFICGVHIASIFIQIEVPA